VLDHDESTYLEISRQLLLGKVLYVDMIDIKPPGIFLILAGFQAVFGHSIFVMRLLVSLWIGLTAFMVFLAGRRLIKDTRASIAGAVIYIFFLSTWSFYGVSITPEIFFNLFTISALYILLRFQSVWKYFLAGMVAGLGFMVKYFVLLDFGVILLFFLLLQYFSASGRMSVKNIVLGTVLAVAGFSLPFGLCNLYFYRSDHWDAFVNIIYLAPSRYPSPINTAKMSKFLLDLQLRFLPFFFFFYFVMFNRKFRFDGLQPLKLFLAAWSVVALIAVVISGNHYGHYTIQLMLPVSLAAGLYFHSGRVLPKSLKWMVTFKTGILLLTFMVALISAMKLEYVFRRDIPREVAAYLKPRLGENDVLYTSNYHHILYYLLKKDSPTPYVHRSILLDNRHIKALDINKEEEFRKIIAQEPAYIVTQKEYPEGMMKDYLEENFQLEKDFGGTIRLYHRVK
jgi:4-amino-4-deoxy-L-arabinose transferase-like glycosyltransferase